MNLAGNFHFMIEARFGARGGKKAGVFHHSGGFARERSQDLAIERRKGARRSAAIEVQNSEEFALARGYRGVERFDNGQFIDGDGDDGAESEAGHAFLLAG